MKLRFEAESPYIQGDFLIINKTLRMKNLFTLVFLFAFCGLISAQTTYYSQDFNDGLPADWSQDGEGWIIGTAAAASSAYFTVPASADGNVACFNDDGLGNGAVGGGRITSGPIDLSSANGDLFLEFSSYFVDGDYQGADETGKVYISDDEGANWREIINVTSSGADFSPAFANIGEYAGSTVWLDFVYDDGQGWNFGWAIDNITFVDELVSVPRRSYAVHAGSSVMIDQAAEGLEYSPSGFVFNSGWEPITSFDVALTDGTETITASVSGVDVGYNSLARFSLDETLLVEGNKTWTMSVTNVNADSAPDDDVSDNEMSFNLNAEKNIHPDKAVAIEEATGTWCTWCPRGAVFLDEMSKRFGDNFVGVAVHNGDPMVLSEYDSSIGSFPGFQGYPSVIYNRETILDPSAIVDPSITDMKQAPVARLIIGGTYDGGTFTGTVDVEFLEDVTGADYNISLVLTEDHVTGTGAGWNQINAYSGGGNGVMGGYELLPGSVPGEIMVYDHVGRALIGGFAGVGGQVSGDFSAGDIVHYDFPGQAIDAGWDTDNMYVNALLINGDGSIANAGADSFNKAISASTSVFDTKIDNTLASIYPNPVTDQAFIRMHTESNAEVRIHLVNAVGQVMMNQTLGQVHADQMIPVDMSQFDAGMYLMHIMIGDTLTTKKITKAE